MKAPFLARKLHKWIALIIGVQVLFWMVSGAYMATISIDFIHGDSLVRNVSRPLDDNLPGLYPLSSVLEQYPDATRVELVSRLAEPHYVVAAESETALLNAVTGQRISPLDEDMAIALARYYYAGKGVVVDANLLADESDKPSEIQTRPLPLWQVSFDDSIATTFYVSPETGALVTRRHTYWRLYDFLWMFHIMDYENRSDLNNNLLRVAALFGFGFTLSGIWLLFYALKRRKTSASAADFVGT
jgi:uncharacterized iron-regulated membrane protein